MTDNSRASDIEALRWTVTRYTFATPEEFEAKRGVPWLADGRNHTTWTVDPQRYGTTPECPGGIQREERCDAAKVEVTDETADAFVRLIVGRLIVAARREPCSGKHFETCENSVVLTLDDGARLHFVGQGYDASCLCTDYEPCEPCRDGTVSDAP